MIFVVVPNLNVSGGIKVGAQWVQALCARGHDAMLIAPDQNQPHEWLGFSVPVGDYGTMLGKPGSTIVWLWMDQLRELAPLFTHEYRWVYFAQDCAQPLYVDTTPGRFEYEYLPLLRKCQLLTVSHPTRRFYLLRYGIPSRVVPSWVDRNKFNAGSVKVSWRVAMIAHRDHYREDVHRHLESLGFECVVAHGSQEDVAAVFRMSQVFVSCAGGRPDGFENSEGLPMPILEAMACWCIPVCPDTNGTRDLVLHGVNGFLVRNGGSTPEDYAAGVRLVVGAYDELVPAVIRTVDQFTEDLGVAVILETLNS